MFKPKPVLFGLAVLLVLASLLSSNSRTLADSVSTTATAGDEPSAVAVNPVTNKVYVANQNSDNVTVIDGSDNSTTTVTGGDGPNGVAVNPVTNKVYVANQFVEFQGVRKQLDPCGAGDCAITQVSPAGR